MRRLCALAQEVRGKLISISKDYTSFFCLLHGKKISILFAMNTLPETPQPKKRGPARRLPPMVDTHLFLPEALLEWAKHHPEGFAGLIRRLLAQEQQKEERRRPRDP